MAAAFGAASTTGVVTAFACLGLLGLLGATVVVGGSTRGVGSGRTSITIGVVGVSGPLSRLSGLGVTTIAVVVGVVGLATGAIVGSGTGEGTGAFVGADVTGAAVGSGTGAVTGAFVGDGVD